MRRLIFLALLAAALVVVLDGRGAFQPEPGRDGADSARIVIDHGTAAARASVVIARAELAVLFAAVTVAAIALLGLSPAARARRIAVATPRSDRSRAPPSR
jgi:hypothetical protein